MAIRGSCLCGEVTFKLEKLKGPFEICHCNRCRKVSGAQGMPAVGADTADYQLLTGEQYIQSFSAPILYRPPAYETHFCAKCGSPVPPAHPQGSFMEIPAGLLDDDPGIKPDKHIFVELTPAWDHISDGLRRFTFEQIVEHRRSNS